jgi:ubiquinone/menaquinone biosynthesis C-methylase UbiE
MTMRTAMPASAAAETFSPVILDLGALKARQQATWSTGDYGIVGTTLQIVGETLCEAADVQGGERVLDVACGNGNAALAAARRWSEVTGVDYVPSLVSQARDRADGDRLPIVFNEGDAEALLFEDGHFDKVLSVFGVMFCADHERAASEMMRVCRPGGVIALANWTPAGFIGQLFRLLGSHVPPAAGTPSPLAWGTRAGIDRLFGAGAARITVHSRHYNFRYASPQQWLDVFRSFYGPMVRAFAALEPGAQDALERDILALLEQNNRATGGRLMVPSEYLEVLIEKR